MQQEFENPTAMLDMVLTQESVLQFAQFTFEDGWKLGSLIRNLVLAHGGDAAVDVTVGGVQLFRCVIGNPSPNNSRWIRRKSNTTLENSKSSLRVTLEMMLKGRTLAEFGLPDADYVLSGGCFPLIIAGQGCIGTATVSGLPQTHDHQMVVNAIAEFLKQQVPSVIA